MPITILRVLVQGTTSPNQPVTLTDQATATAIASGSSDAAGAFSIPVQFEEFIQGIAVGHADAAGVVSFPASGGAGAGGAGGGSGTLTQQQPLAGAADGHGAGSAPVSRDQGLQGAAAGHAAAAGAPSVVVPGSLSGSAGGQAGASAGISVNVPLGGSAGGSGGAGPSVEAQALPIAAAGAGQGAGAGAISLGAALAGSAAGHGAGAAPVTVTSGGGSGVSYVGAGTVFSGVEGDVPLPAPAGGIRADDILIMHGEDLSAADLPPAGWLFKTSGGWDSVYWRRAGASEVAPHIIGPSDGDGSNFARAERIYAFRGCVASGDPFDVTSGAPVLAGSGSTATGSALTTLAGSFLGFLVHSLPAATDAGGDTLVTTTFGGGNDSLAYRSVATTAGVQAAPAITLASSGAKTHWTFALKAA